MKKIILLFLLVCMMMGGITACGNKNSTSGNSNANIVNGGYITKQDEWLYYAIDNCLYKCKEDGSEKQKLLSGESVISDINVVGENIYFNDLGLCKAKTDGTDVTKLISEENRGIYAIGDWIYYGNEYRLKLDGSGVEKIYDSNSVAAYTLNIIENWMYFTEADSSGTYTAAYKMKTDGSGKQDIFSGYARSMVVAGDWIYFIDMNDNAILFKMKTDGTDKKVVTEARVGFLNIVDDWIYYYNYDGGLYKIKTDGSDKQMIYNGVALNLHIIDDWIYYRTDFHNTQLYRIKIDGTQNQLFAQLGEV